jgi:hypothetical protein
MAQADLGVMRNRMPQEAGFCAGPRAVRALGGLFDVHVTP